MKIETGWITFTGKYERPVVIYATENDAIAACPADRAELVAAFADTDALSCWADSNGGCATIIDGQLVPALVKALGREAATNDD